jgi:outer membrane lipoprotein-sorting protein
MLMIAAGLVLSLPLAAASGAEAMDAEKLIDKAIDANGGLKKIQSTESIKATGKFLTQGMEFPFTMTQKRPGKMKIEAEIMGATMIQCFADGEGWSINPMMGSTDPQPMSEMEAMGFKVQSDMDGVLIDYEKKGYTVEFIGEEDVEGTPTYHLKVDTNFGIVMDMYFDQEYFLNIKTATKLTLDENEFETQTYLSDFQEVEGLIMPFSIETRNGDMVMQQVMMEKVELNLEVDDAIFAKPAAEEKPTAPEPADK